MDSLKWKRRVGRWLAPARRARSVVLLYHSVGGSPWATRPERFREQLRWLRESAVVVPLQEMCRPTPGGTDALKVAISFDDGYASLHDTAAPLLEDHGMGATVFLNTRYIADGPRCVADPALGHYAGETFMTWAEALALARRGWILGSHGVHHVDLTREPPARVATELAASKAAIEARTGSPCEGFAYPWGRSNPQVRSAVRAAGYAYAVSGLHGPVNARIDPYALPRIDVRAEYELADFIAAVTGRWDFLGLKQRVMHAAA